MVLSFVPITRKETNLPLFCGYFTLLILQCQKLVVQLFVHQSSFS